MSVYLSKTKYCQAIQCNKILWLDKYKKEFATDTSSESILADGIEVGKNREYIRKGELDLKRLFKIENITDIVNSKQNEVEEKIKEINEYMEQEEEPKECFCTVD